MVVMSLGQRPHFSHSSLATPVGATEHQTFQISTISISSVRHSSDQSIRKVHKQLVAFPCGASDAPSIRVFHEPCIIGRIPRDVKCLSSTKTLNPIGAASITPDKTFFKHVKDEKTIGLWPGAGGAPLREL